MKSKGPPKDELKRGLLDVNLDVDVDPVVVCLQGRRCENCRGEARASQVLA